MWAALQGVLMVREGTADWRPRPSERSRVRARGPHASEADPEVPHDEYAVLVGDDGLLITYVPLAAHEEPTRSGSSSAACRAREHATAEYDPRDAARAAEQLAEAQEHAARLEAAAIERALAELAADAEARELVAETRGTSAALHDITGQQRPPGTPVRGRGFGAEQP